MKIEALYVYPIKSFRGVAIDNATLTKFGFLYDRYFMILQVQNENGNKTLKNMSVASFNEMVRFFPEINSAQGTMTVTFKPVGGGESKSIDIPLEPDTSDMEVIDIVMHLSPTQAYKMADKYNDWLSDCFGYECVLAYIGENVREVRMSSNTHKVDLASGSDGAANGSWLSSITTAASKATGMILGNSMDKPAEIKFSDVAPYLVVSSKSMEDVQRRLPSDETYEITKFRPNIIVSGAEKPWDEDFWAELAIGGETPIYLDCEHNCARCKSINVDYETGAPGKLEAGKMLKKLSSDRRVDVGAKWTPVFGRYAFLRPACGDGEQIRVGDEVEVSRINKEHTQFNWKGLSTLPGGGR